MTSRTEDAYCDDVEGKVTAEKEGKRRMVVITVDYCGNDMDDEGSYSFSYSVSGIQGNGDVPCPGPDGKTDKDKFRLRFMVVPGDTIDDVAFKRISQEPGVDFKVGVVGPDGCVVRSDATELDDIKVKNEHKTVTVRNHKKNSELDLGYRFSVKVTHVTGDIRIIAADPRIINRTSVAP